MLNVIVNDRAPLIGGDIQSIILELDDVSNFVLSLQLDYHDCNTIFYLDKVDRITFRDDLLHISQTDKSNIFLSYENILEYSIINAEELISVEERMRE